MNDGLIPRRYAKALYKVAAEKGKQKEIYGTMNNLIASFRSAPELTEVVRNPCQSNADKLMLLHTAAGSPEGSDPLFDDFLQLLIRNNRLEFVEAVANAFCALYREENNIRIVTLTTAAPLDKTRMDRLRGFITSHLDGATMEFRTSVDPSLTGGFIVTIDNERLDASISNELKQLRLKLLSKQSS
ncbi:MAG: F0F1 ATP synthase subunit delta [Clostridium sp.]|nr:F0F1 ATP synthase subunit delta [Clostridium sp.]